MTRQPIYTVATVTCPNKDDLWIHSNGLYWHQCRLRRRKTKIKLNVGMPSGRSTRPSIVLGWFSGRWSESLGHCFRSVRRLECERCALSYSLCLLGFLYYFVGSGEFFYRYWEWFCYWRLKVMSLHLASMKVFNSCTWERRLELNILLSRLLHPTLPHKWDVVCYLVSFCLCLHIVTYDLL